MPHKHTHQGRQYNVRRCGGSRRQAINRHNEFQFRERGLGKEIAVGDHGGGVSIHKIVLQVLLRKLVTQVDDVVMRSQLADFRDLMQVEMPTAAVKAAVIVLTIGPIILVYPFLQRYFIKGIFLGSLKG